MRQLRKLPHIPGVKYGFGKAPPSVQADVARRLKEDGHKVLMRGAVIGAGAESLAAHSALRTIWTRLDEMFFLSGLLRMWRPVRILAKTLASTSINGCAGQAADASSPYFFVGLRQGLFIHTTDRLMRILSEPEAFPKLGASSLEQAGRTGGLLEVVPRDSQREAAALAMATVAVAAVFAHEVGHIVRGHIWLLRSRFGLTRLYEVGGAADGDYGALRRTMELDADVFSGKVIGTFLFDAAAPDWCGVLGKNRRTLLHLLALSLTCAFRTFEEQAPDDVYHTPFLRAQLITTAARDLAGRDVPFDFEDFKTSAWLPELLQILGPTAGRLDTASLRIDFDAMLATYRETIAAQKQFQFARDEMNAVLSRARI